ncbi:MAG: right-handed parallel beta-helix repeat-containing protein [Fibrobacterota bacterium]
MISHRLRLLLPFFLSVCIFAEPPDSLSGKITENLELGPENGPIMITDNVTLLENCTLSVKPGTRFEFDGYFQLIIRGFLIAEGDQQKKIVFTSSMKKPARSDWYGVAFRGEKSGGRLAGCTIEYAYKNICFKSSPVVKECIFRENTYGLYMSYATRPEVVSCVFENNIYGLYCDFSGPYIADNLLTGNEFGIYMIFSAAPQLENNVFKDNREKNIFRDQSMEKKEEDDKAMDLIKGLF